MSVQTEIDRIITAVGAAYDAVETKGGTLPASETVANLAEAISSIPKPSAPYVLPQATADALGGIKADAKTSDDVLPVRIDTDGKLWASQFVDATADFMASGADDYPEWASMVDANDSSKYRVQPGTYCINGVVIIAIFKHTGYQARNIMVIDQAVGDGFVYVRTYGSNRPGDYVLFLDFDSESKLLRFYGNNRNFLLPSYDGSENGHVVKMVDGAPQWASLDPVDATADFLASGKATDAWSVEEVAAWAAMAKTNVASQYRVAEGKYVIWDNAIEKYNIKISTVGESRNIEIQVLDEGCFSYFCHFWSSAVSVVTREFFFSTEEHAMWWGEDDSARREALLPEKGEQDGGKFLSVNKQLGYAEWADLPIPTATAADAGKILTVGADGNYALTELPKYDGGVS